MAEDKLIYVVDTNIIVDYVDIIPGSPECQPEEPTIDLSEAHIVIPTTVVRELSKFKKEHSDRGKAATVALRRLRRLFENHMSNMDDVYNLRAPVSIGDGKQLISIMPVHKNFDEVLPFAPSREDMDGQIILTTLATAFAAEGYRVDGKAYKSDHGDAANVWKFTSDKVTLLTNDNGLAVRARERGIRTTRYGYKYPEPYTGRRDIVVPAEMFREFYNTQRIELEDWNRWMPDQPRLIANEFIIMKLEDEEDYPFDFDPKSNPYFHHIGRYDCNERAIVALKYVRDFPVCLCNDGQAIYAEALLDPDVAAIVCTGPAGSGKTYMAAVYGYESCKRGDFIGVTVVPCDSHSKIGALPGDLDEKMDPEVQPLKNALRNYLLNEDSKYRKKLENQKKYGTNNKAKPNGKNITGGRENGNYPDTLDSDYEPTPRSIKQRLKDHVEMIWDNWFSNIPIENARGRDFSYELAIYDEFQDQSVSQADTLIKRLGTEGKIIITGDIEQIHAPYIDSSSSGLVYATKQLKDSPMVAQVCFTEEEVIRHPLVRMIAQRQKNGKKKG